MNKVITLNLNGNAYQLEENGYDALRVYLESASRRLEKNPDKDEIVSDIEQAIADKFRASLGPHKTVVLAREVEKVIAEMGPVEDDSAPDESKRAGAATAAPRGEAASDTHARRLYKIREGAMIAGVCNGLAAFSGMDVTVLRVLFALVTVFSFGTGALIYLLLALLLPTADTAAEKAAATGGPSTTQEFIRRAREGYYEGMKSFHDREARRAWRRKFRREMRGWGREAKREAYASGERAGENWRGGWVCHPYPVAGSWAALPFLSLAKVLLTFAWIFSTFSLLATGAIFGVALPTGVPLWVGLIFLFVAFRFVVWPLKAARRAYYYRAGFAPWHACGVADSFVWLCILGLLLWLADRYVPQVHTALQQLPPVVHHAIDSLRAWWARR